MVIVIFWLHDHLIPMLIDPPVNISHFDTNFFFMLFDFLGHDKHFLKKIF